MKIHSPGNVMIHSSSISRREIQTHSSLKDESNELHRRRPGDRYQYNISEFRDNIRHAFSQTDIHYSTSESSDVSIQVDTFSNQVVDLTYEIGNLMDSLYRERSRNADRERILISQMNAIRDQQLYDKKGDADDVTIAIRITDTELRLDRIPRAYTAFRFEVKLLRRDDADESAFTIRKFEPCPIQHPPHLLLPELPMHFRVPHTCGQMSICFQFFASSEFEPDMFDLFLGEWASPPFVPCMKETRKPEISRMIFPKFGVLDIEVVFN